MQEQLRILFVEDSALDAEVLLRFLKHHKFQLEYERVETPEELTAALTQYWDLIFCDYNIHPNFTGLDAIRLIREYERQKPPDAEPPLLTPIIVISSIVSESAVIQAMNIGATDCIIKGYLDKLVPVINREMYNSGLVRQYYHKWREAQAQLENKS